MSAEVLAELVRCRLLSEEQATALAGVPPADLLPRLREFGWLTDYQAHAVATGQAARLLFGSFVLVEPVGEGGMGQVFKARDWRMGRLVALKLIRPHLLSRPEAVQRFYREARAAAALDGHPNVVRALDAGDLHGTHYLALEFVDGTDLARLVKDRGPMPVAAACEVVRKAALGLQHAFERGMVHRDIKPHNLMLARDGSVKVMDLGLARPADGDGTTLTETGNVIGTPDFMSPEQARDSKSADIRSDLYSLGCTLYYLLAGRAPFTGESALEKLLAHATAEPEPLHLWRPDVPPRVAAVIRRLLEKDPADRFQTPAELAEALADPELHTGAAMAEAASAASTLSGWDDLLRSELPASGGPAPRRPRGDTFPWAVAAGAGGLLLAVGLAVLAVAVVTHGPAGPPAPSGPPFTATADAASALWQDTGIDLPGGSVVPLGPSVGAVWKSAAVPDGCGPQGSSTAARERNVVEAEPTLCLLGRVGAGDPFALGSARKFRVPAGGGRLFLRANSLDPADGRMTVTVEAGSRGEPAAAPPPTRAEAAEAAAGPLLAEEPGADGRVAYCVRLRQFLRDHSGTAAAASVARRLTREVGRLPSPLDALDPGLVSPMERAGGLPTDVVAAFGGQPNRQWRRIPWRCLVTDPRGGQIATGDGPLVRLWDAASLRPRSVLAGHKDDVACLAFGPGGRLYSGSGEGLRVWDTTVDPPRELAAIAREGFSVARIAADPNGRWLALAGFGSKDFSIWDVTGKEPVERGIGRRHAEGIENLVVSAGGVLASCAGDGLVCLWDVDDGKATLRGQPFKVRGRPGDLAFTADDKLLAVADWMDERIAVRILAVGEGGLTDKVTVETGGGRLAWSADSRTLFAGNNEGLSAFDPWSTPPARNAEIASPGGYFTAISRSTDGKSLFTSDNDGMLRVWDVSGDRPTLRDGSRTRIEWPHALAFSPDSTTLYEGPIEGVFLARTLPGAAAPAELRAPEGSETGLAVAPDGKTLATIHHNRDSTPELWLWDATARRPGRRTVLRMPDHGDRLSFSPDGRLLVAGLRGWRLAFWDATVDPPVELPGTIEGSTTLAFAPDGKTLALAGDDGSATLVDLTVRPPKTRTTLKPEGGGDTGTLVYSPDGRTLAVAGRSPPVRLWDLSVGTPRERALPGRQWDVIGVYFNVGDADLLTADSSGVVVEWKGEAVRREWRFPGPVVRYALAPDGRHLAAAGRNGRTYLLRLAAAP